MVLSRRRPGAQVSFIRLRVLANLATAFSMVWAAVMKGGGDTRPPMVIAILASWVVELPLAYLLAIPIGVGVKGIG